MNPSKPLSFKNKLGAIWHDSSFLLLYAYKLDEEETNKRQAEQDITDISWYPDDYDDDDLASMFGPFDNNDDNDQSMPQQQTITDEVFAPDPRQTITVDDADISSIKQPSNNNSNNNNNTNASYNMNNDDNDNNDNNNNNKTDADNDTNDHHYSFNL
jgi:hypothetical protein